MILMRHSLRPQMTATSILMLLVAFCAIGCTPGESPMHVAARSGLIPELAKAHAAGGDVNGRSPTNRTPLMLAVQEGHPEAADWLIQHGADVNLTDNDQDAAAAFRCPLWKHLRGPDIAQLGQSRRKFGSRQRRRGNVPAAGGKLWVAGSGDLAARTRRSGQYAEQGGLDGLNVCRARGILEDHPFACRASCECKRRQPQREDGRSTCSGRASQGIGGLSCGTRDDDANNWSIDSR